MRESDLVGLDRLSGALDVTETNDGESIVMFCSSIKSGFVLCSDLKRCSCVTIESG